MSNVKVYPSKHQISKLFRYEKGFLIRKITVNGRAKAGDIIKGSTIQGYVRVRINKESYLVHRLIYILHYGEIPDGYEVDHKDRNKSNNVIENLRLVTSQENSFNLPAKGWSFDDRRQKYRAFIKLNGVTKTLGNFDTEDEAVLAYLQAKRDYHPITTQRGF